VRLILFRRKAHQACEDEKDCQKIQQKRDHEN
jgi:hypothetical protein